MSKLYTDLANTFRKYVVDDEKGVTAIEYGLIAALIAVGLIVVLPTAGGALTTIFVAIRDALVNAAGQIPG